MIPLKIRSQKSSINISQYLKKTTCTISSQSRHYHKPPQNLIVEKLHKYLISTGHSPQKLHKYPTTGSRWALNPPSSERLTHAARSCGSKINAAIYFDLVRSFIFTSFISTTKISIFCIVIQLPLFVCLSIYIFQYLGVSAPGCLYIFLFVSLSYFLISITFSIKHIPMLQYRDAFALVCLHPLNLLLLLSCQSNEAKEGNIWMACKFHHHI